MKYRIPMVPLALGLATDFYIVLDKVLDSTPLAIALATISLVFFYGLWFGFTFYRRRQQRNDALRHRLIAPTEPSAPAASAPARQPTSQRRGHA